MRFLLAESADAGHKTLSSATLTSFRLVSKEWNRAVDDLQWKSLIATPSFLVLNNGQRPLSKFYERMRIKVPPRNSFETVSFNLCTRFISSETKVDEDCAKLFTSVLTSCRSAHIAVDLLGQELDVHDRNHGEVQQVEVIELRNFSWTSPCMGIRHVIPEKYGFPSGWQTLKQGLPWAQLTHVDLNCPLSIGDVYFILQSGSSNLLVARLATVKDAANLGCSVVIKLDSLEFLTIHSQLALDDLLSLVEFPKLICLELNIDSRLFSTRLGSILDKGHPWQQLYQIELTSPLSISDVYLVFSHGRTNLKHVHLATIEETAQIQQNSFVEMSSLLSLTIQSLVSLQSLFSRLLLPSLKRLALTLDDADDVSDLSSLQTQPPMLDSNLNVPWNQLLDLNITYNCIQECAMTPILLKCGGLKRISMSSSTSRLRFDPNTGFPAEIELGLGVRCEDILDVLTRECQQLTSLKTVLAPSLQAITVMGTRVQLAHLHIVDAITIPVLSKALSLPQLITGKFRVREAKKSELDVIIGGIERPYVTVEVSQVKSN